MWDNTKCLRVACQIQFDKSNVTSGGLGTMGFALPAAIGAKMGMPDREVVAIIGEMEVSNDHSRIRNYFPNQSSRENCSLKQ
jgi:hypothetical protein